MMPTHSRTGAVMDKQISITRGTGGNQKQVMASNIDDTQTTSNVSFYNELDELQNQIKGKIFIDDKKRQQEMDRLSPFPAYPCPSSSTLLSSSSFSSCSTTTGMTFQDASHIWNQITLPPLAVIEVHDEEDIVKVLPYLIRFQKDYDIPFRIRSGGHHYASWFGIENGIILSLTSSNFFNRIHHFDEMTGIATFGPSVRVEEILMEILVKRGYGSTVGVCSAVGEGGFILGGGIGFVGRQHGLVLDNIISALVESNSAKELLPA